MNSSSLSSSMASSLTSFSSVFGHPHCGLRLNKLHSRCRLGLRVLPPPKPQASVSRCFCHRTSRPLRQTFPLAPSSRSFSQSHISAHEGPSLRHFIAQAALTASSEARPELVIPNTRIITEHFIYIFEFIELFGIIRTINSSSLQLEFDCMVMNFVLRSIYSVAALLSCQFFK